MVRQQKPRSFVIDPQRAQELVTNSGMTFEQLAAPWELGISKKTLRKILRGQPVYISSVNAFSSYFDKPINELLMSSGNAASTSGHIGDWTIMEPLGPVEETPNRLQFRRYRLVRNDSELIGRGKRFFLDHLSLSDRRQVQEHLLRHTNVCNQVGPHPNIACHLEIKSDSGDDLWWVIDKWIEGPNLEQLATANPLSPALLRDISLGVAEGLAHLHKYGVILRHLAPSSVIVSQPTMVPVLVDFEMAKLIGRRPTVAPGKRWPADDYRAPEVGGTSEPTVSADVYSWARVFLHAATRVKPPPPGQEVDALGEIQLPKSVRSLVHDCLSLNRHDRPQSMRSIIRTMRRWKCGA